jgi:hypothetical protein
MIISGGYSVRRTSPFLVPLKEEEKCKQESDRCKNMYCETGKTREEVAYQAGVPVYETW